MKNETSEKILKKFAVYINSSPNFSDSTKFNYPKIIEYYLSYLEAFNIGNINDVDQGLMVKFARFKGNREYANAYFNLRISALKAFYTWAYKNRVCSRHLILEYRKNKLVKTILSGNESNCDKSSITILQAEERQKLLNNCVENEFMAIRNKCIVDLILASALSATEIITLPLSALNLDHGFIDIVDTSKERRVKIDIALCRQSTNDWLKIRNNTLSEQNPCQLLFFTKNFEQLTKRMLHKIVSKYLLRVGITKEHLGPDVLRQTAICYMFKNQRTLEEVQQATSIQTLARLEKYRQISVVI